VAGKIRRIWEALAACFDANDQPLTKGQILAWIGRNYPDNDLHPATLDAQIRRSCINVPFAQKYKAPKILLFDRETRTYSRASSSDLSQENIVSLQQTETMFADDDDESLLETEDQSDLLVGLEAQLRDYLAKNLGKLEKGLVFWNDSPLSVEYFIDGKRIDILAKDVEGVPVVVELKRAKAYDKVVGQALLYQALVANKLRLERVRVILVANVMSPELLLACSRQADFKLFEYEITMQLNPIDSFTSEEEA
jgi:hypothetical protein